ncbi:phage tail tape measure protein [uncultured Mediterranean phage uvMED]|nr:phage tail tape measure protein [uncultured Mediterranean phage uvMED]
MTTTVLTAKFDFSQPKSAIKGTQAQVDQLKNKAKGAQGALDNAAKSAKGAGVASAFFGKAATGAVPGVAALGTALKTALGPIALLTSAAGVLTSAFSTLAQQDFAEAKVRSLGVDSEKLTKQLAGVSRELAGQASVTELTGAAYDVASAGFTNAADAANILKAASLGATGGFSDINTVGDATTSVLNAYGLEADKAAKLVDGFIQTQNDGKIVIGEYAANIAKVAPVAAALGVPLEEINAAVAQITAGGQGAEVTFTALKTAFAQVAAGKVGDEFKKFGVDISASTLKSDGLAGTLEKIKKSGADAGTIIKAFGTEAGPSILALLNDTEKYNRLLENQKNSQGQAAKAAFESSNTINGALKRLQTAFTNIFADGAELGVLLKGTFQVAAVTVEVFGAALKLVLAPIRGLIQGVTTFFAELKPFGENINLAYELEKGFQAVMSGVDFATKAITGFFAITSNLAYTTLGNVINFANGIREGIGGIFNDLGATIRSTLENLYANIPRPIQFIIEEAGKGFKAVQGFLGQAVSGVVNKIKGAGQGIAQGVKELAIVGGFDPAASTQSTAAAANVSAANAIQQTGGDLLTPGGKPKTKEQTDAEKERKDQLAQKDKLLKKLDRQFQLETAVDDKQRRQLELNFKIADLKTQFPKLTEDELKPLEDKLRLSNDTVESKILQEALDKKAQENADKLTAQYEQLDSAFRDGIVDSIMSAVDGTKSLSDSLVGVIKQMAKLILQQQLMNALSGFSFSSFFGFRANGGPVSAGNPYIVGERGPEMFVPSGSGKIVANDQLGGSTNVVVNVDASGTNVEGDEGSSRQLGALVGAAVQNELIKQQRPGGLLSR